MSYVVNFDSNNFKPTEDITEPLLKRWVLQTAIEFVTLKTVVEELEFYGSELINIFGLEKWQSKAVPENKRQKVIQHIQNLWSKANQAEPSSIKNNFLCENIHLLTKLLSLSSSDIKLLLFTLYIKNFKSLEEITDKLGSDISDTQLINLLAGLFFETNDKITALLSPSSKLLSTGLIELDSDNRHVDSKLTFVSSRFSNALVSRKLTTNEIIKEFAYISAPASLCLGDYEHIQQQLDILHPYLEQALETGKQGVNIFIYGPPGTGKTQLAKVLSATIDSFPVSLYEIASLDIDKKALTGEARLKALTACQNFIQSKQSMILIDEVEDIFNDSTLLSNSTATESKAWLTTYLEQNHLPTIWVSNTILGIDPAFLRRFDFILELDVPPEQYRKKIIERECGGLISKQTIAELAAHPSLSPAVVCKASQIVEKLPDCDIAARSSAIKIVIDNMLEAQGHNKLKTHPPTRINSYNPKYINADIDLTKTVDGLKRHSEGRICFYGPPGTGKTAFGHYLAKQLNKKLLVKKASDLISMYVGGTEQNLAAAFEQATKENAVLMLDEVDSFLQDRKQAIHSWEITAVNEMLTQMEAFNGVFIASTNLMSNLDEASIRRFDLKVKFNYLNLQQTEQMFNEYTEYLSLEKALNKSELNCLSRVTPGDFALIARRHKFSKMKTDAELLSTLTAEVALKESHSTNRIGFL